MAFLRANPHILPQELNRWVNAKRKLNPQTGEIYKISSKSVTLRTSVALPRASDAHFSLTAEQHQHLQQCAAYWQQSPQQYLSYLLNEEALRCALLAEDPQTLLLEVQALSTAIGLALKGVNKTSEMFDIASALDNLVVTLLKDKAIDTTLNGKPIAESERLPIPRAAYYWYGRVAADKVGRVFATKDVYLWHEWFNPHSELLYVGSSRNVLVSYLVCQRLCALFKQIKTQYKQSLGQSGSSKDREALANDYIYHFISGVFEHVRMIYDEASSIALIEYACDKYEYAMR